MGQHQRYSDYMPTEYTPNGKKGQGRGWWCPMPKVIGISTFIFLLMIGLLVGTFFITKNTYNNEACTNDLKNEASEQIAAAPENTSSCLMISPDVPINLTGDQLNIDSNVTEEAQVVSTISLQTEADKTNLVNLYRLPNDLRPTKYRLKIIPLLFLGNNLTTIGEVNIQFQCLNETNEIVLNVKDLIIEDTISVWRTDDNEPQNILRVDHDEKSERFSVILQKHLSKEQYYNIHIKYNGKINDIPCGVYRSSFVEPETKEKRWVLSTLFSPTDARQAFPSFDEPAYKARFTLSIGRPKDLISLSNTNISSVQPLESIRNWVWDNYHETSPMSTYLTGFVVAPYKSLLDFKYTSAKSHPVVNGYARPNALHQISYAVDLAPKIIKYFEDEFKIDFPLPKIDIVAVPSQFFDAMENSGLIIFREDSLLVMPNSTEALKQKVALKLAHEICHQWCGNLVTPKWWDTLWTKEGPCTLAQYEAIDKIMPHWKIFEHFTRDEVEVAFKTDSLSSSRALSEPVNKPNKELFDVSKYHKGASIMRMLKKNIGESSMKAGFSSYLKKFSFKNANQDDLWNALNSKNDQDVDIKTVMDSWTLQAGYPIVTLIRDYEKGTIIVSQERSFLREKSGDESLWWIPITYTIQPPDNATDNISRLWLNGTRIVYLKNLPIGNLWILANVDNSGFYRVNYDIKNWIMLIDNYHELPIHNTAQLIRDSFHMARSGKLEYEIALSIASELSSDTNYIPWEAVSPSFHYIRNLLINMPAYGDLRTFILTIMQRVYDSLNNAFTNTQGSEIHQAHKVNILNLACRFKYNRCINSAVQIFRRFLAEPEERYLTPKSIREIIYCTAIENGGRAEWEYLYAIFRKSAIAGDVDTDEQQRIVKAMGCTSEPWLLTRSLGMVLQPDSYLTPVNGLLLFEAVAHNNIGHHIAVSFIREKWRDLLEFYGIPTVIYKMVYTTVTYINTPYDMQELKKLVSDIKKVTMEESAILDQAIETAENNVLWMAKNYPIVSNWIRDFNHDYLGEDK